MASSLLGLSRSEQENEKRFNTFRLYAHAGTLAVSVAALFVDDPLTYVLALAAVVTEGVALGLRRYGKKLHDRAERARRHSFLEEALGPTGSPLARARLEGEFSQRAQQSRETWDDPKYWATQGEGHDKGPALLRVNLQESAFYSADLFKVAGQRSAVRLAVFFVVLLCVALILLSIGIGDGGQVFARITAVVLAVLVSADEAGVMLDYLDAAQVADTTVTELTHADIGRPRQRPQHLRRLPDRDDDCPANSDGHLREAQGRHRALLGGGNYPFGTARQRRQAAVVAPTQP